MYKTEIHLDKFDYNNSIRLIQVGDSKNLKLNIGGDIYMKTFYHGTSDILDVKKIILSPIQTNNLREEWRKKYIDKVFFTTSLLSAENYAKKACKKYGGSPVVYIVKPIGQYFNRMDCEYIAEKARIIGQVLP